MRSSTEPPRVASRTVPAMGAPEVPSGALTTCALLARWGGRAPVAGDGGEEVGTDVGVGEALEVGREVGLDVGLGVVLGLGIGDRLGVRPPWVV